MPVAADPLDFQSPAPAVLRRRLRLLRRWFAPQFFGLEHVGSERPALFVGNHTIYGGLDGPLMIAGVQEATGVYLRALADRVHFRIPFWRSELTRFGGVEGSRENCSRLMQAGQSILVYPGGGREVAKNRGESYQLIWKNRTGFAAMAMEHGYDIIPFAALGAEEAYDIRFDANDLRASRLGRLLEKRGWMEKYLRNGELFMPLATGVAGTLLPRPEKLYFRFGPRIPTAALQSRHDDKDAQWQLRRQVEEQVYAQLDELRIIRTADPDWSWWRRRLTARG